MSLLLLFAGSSPGGTGVITTPPEAQSAPGGDYTGRPTHVGKYEVFGYSERIDRDDDDAVAILLALL